MTNSFYLPETNSNSFCENILKNESETGNEIFINISFIFKIAGRSYFFFAICEPVTYFLKSYIWRLIYAEGGETLADHKRHFILRLIADNIHNVCALI